MCVSCLDSKFRMVCMYIFVISRSSSYVTVNWVKVKVEVKVKVKVENARMCVSCLDSTFRMVCTYIFVISRSSSYVTVNWVKVKVKVKVKVRVRVKVKVKVENARMCVSCLDSTFRMVCMYIFVISRSSLYVKVNWVKVNVKVKIKGGKCAYVCLLFGLYISNGMHVHLHNI